MELIKDIVIVDIDIKGSRKDDFYENKLSVNEKIEQLLKVEEFNNSLIEKPIQTQGDTFRLYIKSNSNYLYIINKFLGVLQPYDSRVVISIGDVSYTSDSFDDNFAFGDALYNLGKKKSRKTFTFMITDKYVNSSNELYVEIIETILSTCSSIKLGWKSDRNEIILDYLLMGYTQKNIGLMMELPQQIISRAVNSARINNIVDSYKLVNRLIDSIFKGE